MKLKNFKIWKSLIFFVVILFFSLIIYNGTRHFVQLPYGIHLWRQSLNYSMIQNFQEPQVSFLKPAMDNLLNPDNTGYLILEFPIFQWLISFLPREYFPYFRWLVFTLSFSGLYFSYLFAYQILKDNFLAISSVLVIFFTPLFLFYNANYFLDVPATLWSISAVYFWHNAIENNPSEQKNLLIGTILYVLAGLLRLVVLSIAFAYMIYYFLDVFKKRKALFYYFLSGTALIIAWYIYQQKNNLTYNIRIPMETSIFYALKTEIQKTLYSFRDMQFNQFGFIFGNVLSYLIFFFVIGTYWRHFERYMKILFVFTLLGTITYFLLWFKVFEEHDYYLIPFLPLFFIMFVMLMVCLNNRLHVKTLYSLNVLILLFCFYHGYENYRLRDFRGWYGWNLNTTKFEEGMFWWFHEEENMKWSKIREISKLDALSKVGIQKHDTVICNFDPTPTFVLSTLQLKGWTQANMGGVIMNRLEHYQDFINRGAKYLLHYGDKPIIEDNAKIDSLFKLKLIFQYDSIKFYRIDHLKNY